MKPRQGKLKLNTDGCSLNNPGDSGAGGLLCDEQGNLIFAYSTKLGNSSSIAIEIKAILQGLKICQERRIKGVIVETDSLMVVQWFSSDKCGVWYLEEFWEEILRLMIEGGHSIQHVFREGNAPADFLAKHGAKGHDRVWHNTSQLSTKL
ncbi:uncharacterized protein LOC122293491 [Carya illinoinensis]|uniref:uncharacterized protein LOC122293491 n=1 Tax=Carya illinoinensis TaxID=32201 RepID=UPI001C728793|nr:uncharacterized protein LOC122293491 [Carya illinoinensis]